MLKRHNRWPIYRWTRIDDRRRDQPIDGDCGAAAHGSARINLAIRDDHGRHAVPDDFRQEHFFQLLERRAQ
jgi:hypothetical protein